MPKKVPRKSTVRLTAGKDRNPKGFRIGELKMEMTKTYTRTYHKKSPDMCSGCEDNFYNGRNPYGVEKCWSYAKAKVVKCVIASNSTPPPFSLTQHCLNCYKRKGYMYLKNFDKIRRGQYKGQYCYAGDRSFWEYK